MSKTLHISLLLLLTLLWGCGKNECYLQFALPKGSSANYRVVHYASGKKGGAMIESVATVMDGKGELRCAVYNPSILYLYAGGNLPTAVYAERHEKIPISGTENNPATWTIGGNRINEDLSLWRNAHATTLFSGTPAEVNEAVADYVRENPDDPVSAIILLTAFSRPTDELLFLDLWYSLGEKAEKNRWLEMTGRADMLLPLRRPGKLVSMALRSRANGVDTIRPSAADATLLFFWNNGMDRRNELIDSLKKLAKEYPDSASRMIADICVDADSISWRSPMRNDSTKNIARFWVPAGLADQRLMSLQVGKTPFFMVVAPNGESVYRGDDVSAAFKAFRRLAPVKSGR